MLPCSPSYGVGVGDYLSGRALASHARGHRFKTCIAHQSELRSYRLFRSNRADMQYHQMKSLANTVLLMISNTSSILWRFPDRPPRFSPGQSVCLLLHSLPVMLVSWKGGWT